MTRTVTTEYIGIDSFVYRSQNKKTYNTKVLQVLCKERGGVPTALAVARQAMPEHERKVSNSRFNYWKAQRLHASTGKI